jgi:ribose transport system substrate-binding protein
MRLGRLSALVMVLAGMGCTGGGGGQGGGPAASPGASPAAKRYRFAVIPKSLDLPVFNYARVGAERKAKELGNVDILWRGPETADQLRQKEILESFITQGVDGIAISSLNGDFLTETIDRAIAAGIPVTTWDADAGRIMGEQTATLLGGKGTVAVITSVGAVNLQRRLEGVREALAKQPGIKIVEVYDIKEDSVRCAEIIATGSRRYPDLGAWISVGGWPVFTRNALDAVDPAKTKFISFDTIPPAPDLLKAGKVQVLIGQKYFGWGAESVRLLADIKAGQPPANPIVDSGVDVVTAANVDEYVAGWKKLEAGQ